MNEYSTSIEYSRLLRAYLRNHLASGHIHGVREGSLRRRAIRGSRVHGAASAAVPAPTALTASSLRAAGHDGGVRAAERAAAALRSSGCRQRLLPRCGGSSPPAAPDHD